MRENLNLWKHSDLESSFCPKLLHSIPASCVEQTSHSRCTSWECHKISIGNFHVENLTQNSTSWACYGITDTLEEGMQNPILVETAFQTVLKRSAGWEPKCCTLVCLPWREAWANPFSSHFLSVCVPEIVKPNQHQKDKVRISETHSVLWNIQKTPPLLQSWLPITHHEKITIYCYQSHGAAKDSMCCYRWAGIFAARASKGNSSPPDMASSDVWMQHFVFSRAMVTF